MALATSVVLATSGKSWGPLGGPQRWMHTVRVPIFPIVVCVRSAYVIGAGVGFRVESGAVALLQLDL